MAKKAKPLFLNPVTTELVWASAAYAYRINGAYEKHTSYYYSARTQSYNTEECFVNNQILAHYALMYPEIMKEKDYEYGRKMLEHFEGLIFVLMKYGKLSDFNASVLNVAQREDWNTTENIRQHYGILISLPQSYA